MNIRSDSDDNLFDIALNARKEGTPGLYSENLSQARREDIELDGRKKFYQLRTKWSWVIIGWISLILIFDIIVTRYVGSGHWNFEKYNWLIHEIFAANLGLIFGMGVIVVKFLFPSVEKDLKSDSDYLGELDHQER